jgi:hypothetical protein
MAWFGAMVVLLAGFMMVSPASAQTVSKDRSCSLTVGSNTLTYDCAFNVKNYQLGSPVSVRVGWDCSGSCGPLVGFGLRNPGFTPSGVTGRLVGGDPMYDDSGNVVGMGLTFVFDRNKANSKSPSVNAHFKLDLMVDNGSGTPESVPCSVDVHLTD